MALQGAPAAAAVQVPAAWHSDPDVETIRESVHSQIFTLFQKRKPGGQNQWSGKLPDFVKRLEAALFNSAATKEEYSDFKTLESRLQDVARRLVHRPGGQAPSSSQGTHGLLPNGVLDPSSGHQPQPAAQQFGVQAGTANPQMMLSAYPGAQGMQPGSGMMPTPTTAAGDTTELLSVKPEPGSTTNGMVPLEGAADPSSFQRSSMPGMVPVSGVMGSSSAMGASLMSNGAPIIKQDAWSMPSPSMVPTTAGGRIGDPSAALISSSAPAAFMPTSAAGGGMMPNPGSSMGGGGMMMMPTPMMGAGMMPNPGSGMGAAAGMMPNGNMGMVPNSMGMVPTVSPTMIPNPGSNMVPSSMGMVPTSMGMVPTSMGMPSPATAAAAAGGAGANGMYAVGGMGDLSSPPLQAGQQQSAQQQEVLQIPQQQEQQQPQQQQPDLLQQLGGQQQPGAVGQQQQQQQQPVADSSGGNAASGAMTMVPVSTTAGRSASPGMGGLTLAAAMDQLPADSAAGGQLQQGQGQQQGQEDSVSQQQFLTGNDNANRSMQERQQYIQKQQRWLLFLRHCAKCQQDEAECQFNRSCRVGKELWTHILQCNNPQCAYPRCTSSKDLLKHHQKCQNVHCPICTPVKEYVRRTRNQGGASGIGPGSVAPSPAQPSSSVTSAPPPGSNDMAAQFQQQQQQQMGSGAMGQQMQPGLSGMKRSASSMLDPAAAAAAMPAPAGYPQGMMPVPGSGMMGMVPQQQQQQQQQQQRMPYGQQHAYNLQQQGYGLQYPQQMQYPPQQMPMQQQYAQQQMPYGQQQMPYGQQQQYMQQQQQQQMGYGPGAAGMGNAGPPGMGGMVPMGNGMPPNGVPNGMEEQTVKKQKTEQDKQQLLSTNTGTSLLECFDYQAIETHVHTTWELAQAAKVPAQMPINPGDECKVCGLTKLTFEPPCIYCTTCGQRIKRGQTYHCTPMEPGCEFRGFWCHGCLQEQKGDRVAWEGNQVGFVFKKDLQKKKNDDEVEEGWVQCDCCDNWVHMICGLFNKGRNDQNVHYLCPYCLQQGLHLGTRERILTRPQAMLEAKDLPTNKLSALLEQRVLDALATDRQQRAAQQNKPVDQVPTAEGLTIRVINNVIKKCEVKQKFFDAFKGDGYPEAFIYRQRVIVLFQKIDGVDVALYCMYVQEYGNDCAPPNRNVVYLSYIDSVKYFRPEIPAASGTSLRTFVYHQILLGYLDYVKKLGFQQMFIWACPPLAGDDYILYCHPSKQKTPRSDRLRGWYHEMLKQAKVEGSVTHVTTLWDSFFEGGRDHRYDKPSVTLIPYLEGDYWPGEAENLLTQIQDGQRSAVTGGNTALSRKAGGNKGKRYGAGPATTDEALLTRLGEILGGNMKEDFMVVHLQEPCSFCRTHVHGNILYKYLGGGAAGTSALARPPPERRFEGIRLESPGPAAPTGPLAHLQICDGCHSTEAARLASGAKSRLPGTLALTDLTQQQVPPLLLNTDADTDMGSEFFETRQAFLSLCQGNHYQFDSLRRAKHSSMMVLYHLHNPEAPAFSSTCNFCHVEIEPGTGLRCTVCTDFDMCRNCKAAGMQHEHPMVRTTDFARRDETRQRLTEQERQERNQQLQKTLTLLVHACSCHDPQCSSTSCRKVRQLFQHAVGCQQKVTGGCSLCKKMWCLLNLHAKSCTTTNCPVPRCRELKELRRRQQAQMETKRRAAYANMIRGQK